MLQVNQGWDRAAPERARPTVQQDPRDEVQGGGITPGAQNPL